MLLQVFVHMLAVLKWCDPYMRNENADNNNIVVPNRVVDLVVFFISKNRNTS